MTDIVRDFFDERYSSQAGAARLSDIATVRDFFRHLLANMPDDDMEEALFNYNWGVSDGEVQTAFKDICGRLEEAS